MDSRCKIASQSGLAFGRNVLMKVISSLTVICSKVAHCIQNNLLLKKKKYERVVLSKKSCMRFYNKHSWEQNWKLLLFFQKTKKVSLVNHIKTSEQHHIWIETFHAFGLKDPPHPVLHSTFNCSVATLQLDPNSFLLPLLESHMEIEFFFHDPLLSSFPWHSPQSTFVNLSGIYEIATPLTQQVI